MRRKIGRTGRLVAGGGLGLISVAAGGGAALAAAEGIGYVDGLALAFSTVSTTGFGPGPQTTAGLAVTMIVFAAGAVCWFAIVVAAFETGIRRSRGSFGGNGSNSIEDPWPHALLDRRRRGRG